MKAKHRGNFQTITGLLCSLVAIVLSVIAILMSNQVHADALILSPVPGTDTIYWDKEPIKFPLVKHHKKYKHHPRCKGTSKHQCVVPGPVMDSDHPTKDPK